MTEEALARRIGAGTYVVGERAQSEEVEGAEGRPVVYCLIPAELAAKLHTLLRGHFRDEPRVEVVVERREGERRSGDDRRAAEGEPPGGEERRRVHDPRGRRSGERRAVLATAERVPDLPRRARRYAERLSFVERVEPSAQDAEDTDSDRMVVAFQAGDRDAFAGLYTRYFDRVFGYLLVVLGRREEAEDATQHVFTNALEALPRFEHRGQPFRAWLFRIARNHSLDVLRREQRIEVTDPHELDRHREASQELELEPPMLSWITDRDLLVFLERLPLPQRQALVLRYTIDLSDQQIAKVMGRSPEDVRVLQHRAVTFLRERLAAVGRGTKRGGRARIRRHPQEATVLRMRRFALLG